MWAKVRGVRHERGRATRGPDVRWTMSVLAREIGASVRALRPVDSASRLHWHFSRAIAPAIVPRGSRRPGARSRRLTMTLAHVPGSDSQAMRSCAAGAQGNESLVALAAASSASAEKDGSVSARPTAGYRRLDRRAVTEVHRARTTGRRPDDRVDEAGFYAARAGAGDGSLHAINTYGDTSVDWSSYYDQGNRSAWAR